MRARFAVMFAAVVLAGCMTQVHTRVERFDSLPPQTAGKSVFFFPSKEQETSAEFAAYGRSIAGRLATLGFREVNDFDRADYAVSLNYGISGARAVTEQIPIYGQTGGGTTYQSGSVTAYRPRGPAYGTYSGTTYSAPTYGVVGMMPSTTTKHSRYLVLKMIDLNASTADKLVAAYEGQVTSEGTTGSFAAMSECMFDALFKEFRRTGGASMTLAGECIRQ